ncbi:MAG TPA: hypothetical protein VFE78_17915 [Gemmataceae bacterium]|nr:hypothetical protein [Gemmataceae bacterium]
MCQLTVDTKAQSDQLATMNATQSPATWTTGYSLAVTATTTPPQYVPANLTVLLQQSSDSVTWTTLSSTKLSFSVIRPAIPAQGGGSAPGG